MHGARVVLPQRWVGSDRHTHMSWLLAIVHMLDCGHKHSPQGCLCFHLMLLSLQHCPPVHPACAPTCMCSQTQQFTVEGLHMKHKFAEPISVRLTVTNGGGWMSTTQMQALVQPTPLARDCCLYCNAAMHLSV
jgi:hypothetical protein